MENGVQYVTKKRSGRESPITTGMYIRVFRHNSETRKPYYADIAFYNYADTIGDNKYYVSYEITNDTIYFSFYETQEDDPIHRYKMVSYSSKNTFVYGEPRFINVARKSVEPFFSELKYPVYYLASTDEYCIHLEDVKRKKLWNEDSIIEREKSDSMNTGRSFEIDRDKLNLVLEATIKAHPTCKSIAKISRSMGYSDGAVSSAISYGKMTYKMADNLDKPFGIKKESYMSESEIVEQAELQKSADNIIDKLYDIIYRAAFNAFSDALNLDNKQ